MAKDYSKIKALASSILECLGDEDEGENPSLPKQENDFNDGGQESLEDLSPLKEGSTGVPKEGKNSADTEDKKKKKDASLAMMGSVLAAKFKK
jgi:hypothetical protein